MNALLQGGPVDGKKLFDLEPCLDLKIQHGKWPHEKLLIYENSGGEAVEKPTENMFMVFYYKGVDDA